MRIKHGQAKNILISLIPGNDYGTLRIENDGTTLPETIRQRFRAWGCRS